MLPSSKYRIPSYFRKGDSAFRHWINFTWHLSHEIVAIKELLNLVVLQKQCVLAFLVSLFRDVPTVPVVFVVNTWNEFRLELPVLKHPIFFVREIQPRVIKDLIDPMEAKSFANLSLN